MPVKKLSIKKGKKGKLAIHKEAPVEEVEEVEDDDLPFEPDEDYPIDLGAENSVGKAGTPIKGKVSVKQVNSADEDFSEVDIEGAEFVQKSNKPTANVGYSMDRTFNIGNYESLKVHVSLHVPSEVDEVEIEGNYVFCKGWVEKKMDEVSTEYVDADD